MTTERTKRLVTMEEFIIESQAKFPEASGELTQLLMDITLGSKIIAREINRSVLKEISRALNVTEPTSFRMSRIEQFATEQMYYALNRSNEVCLMVTDDMREPERLKNGTGKYIVVIDPLDGTKNIPFNGAIATTFSIYCRNSDPDVMVDLDESLLPGVSQIAGGYILYGSSIMLVFTAQGLGVNFFTLDPAIGEFFLSIENVKVPAFKPCFSINTALYELWGKEDQAYFDFIISGSQASRGPFSMRYGGSMVSDVHRILMEGGIFAYPANTIHPNGKLHLMYKCSPLSFIMEQAGGIAIDGKQRILDIVPSNIHQTTPVYMGSPDNMEQLRQFVSF
jgi:fructose-1,6-bisphosphatase I